MTIQYDTVRNLWTVSNRAGTFASSARREVLERKFPSATLSKEKS